MVFWKKKNGTKRKTKIRKKNKTLVLVEENILTVKKSRPHFIALILIVSEDATTSQVASTCLQNEYDCIVLFYFLSFGAKGGKVGYSSEVPDVRVCVCECEWMWIVEVLCENSVNVKSTSGVFLHNKRITDLSTSDCLVTLMHNLFVRVMGGEKCQRGAWTTSQH